MGIKQVAPSTARKRPERSRRSRGRLPGARSADLASQLQVRADRCECGATRLVIALYAHLSTTVESDQAFLVQAVRQRIDVPGEL
jgi:hypothetical protein